MGGKCLPLESKEIIHFVYGKCICSLHRLLTAAKATGSEHPGEGEGAGLCQLHGPAHTQTPESLWALPAEAGRVPWLCDPARLQAQCRMRLEPHTLASPVISFSSALPVLGQKTAELGSVLALLQPSLFSYFCQLKDNLHSAFPEDRDDRREDTQHTEKKRKNTFELCPGA